MELLVFSLFTSALAGGAAFLWPRIKHLGVVGKADRLVRSFFLPNTTWSDAFRGRNYRKTMPSNITTYTYSLTEQARKGLLKPVYGREAFVGRILGQFQTDKRFLLMTGRAGSGKTALMEKVAAEMATNPQFSSWEVRMLRVSELRGKLSLTTVTDIAAGGTAARVLRELINEVVEENMQGRRIALFIDEFLSVANCGVFSEFKGPLSDGNLPIFGALTHQEFIEKNVMNSVAGSDEAMRRRVTQFELPQFEREQTFAACRVRLEGEPPLPQELFSRVQDLIGTHSIRIPAPPNQPASLPTKSAQVTIPKEVVEACTIMGASLETHLERKIEATRRLIHALASDQARRGGGPLSLESAWSYFSSEQNPVAYTRQIELLLEYIWPLKFDDDALWYAYLEGHRERSNGVDPDLTLNCLTKLVNQIRSVAIRERRYGSISITLDRLLHQQFGNDQAEIARARAQLCQVQDEERALGGILEKLLIRREVGPSIRGEFPESMIASAKDFEDIFKNPFASKWQGLAIQGAEYTFYGLQALIARNPQIEFYTLDLGFFQGLVDQAQREAISSEFREIRVTAAQKLAALQQQLKVFLLNARNGWTDSQRSATSSSLDDFTLSRARRAVLILQLPAAFLTRIEESCGALSTAQRGSGEGLGALLTSQAGAMVGDLTRGISEMASPITNFLESQFNFNIGDLLNATRRTATPLPSPAPSSPGAPPAPLQPVEIDLWQLPLLSGLLQAMSTGLVPYLVRITDPIPEGRRPASGVKLAHLNIGSEKSSATLLQGLFNAPQEVSHAALLIAKEQGHQGDAQIDSAAKIIQEFTQTSLGWDDFLKSHYPQDHQKFKKEGELKATSLLQTPIAGHSITRTEEQLSRDGYSRLFAELYSTMRPALFVLESSPVRRRLIRQLISNALLGKGDVRLRELNLRPLDSSPLPQDRELAIIEEQLETFKQKSKRKRREHTVLVVTHSPLLASERIRSQLREIAALKGCSLVYLCDADQFNFPGQQSGGVASTAQVGGQAPAANPVVSLLEKGAQFIQNPMAAINSGALSTIVEAGKNLLSDSQQPAPPPTAPSESAPPVEQLSGKKNLFIQGDNYRLVRSGPIKKEEIEWVVQQSTDFILLKKPAKTAFIKLVEWEVQHNSSFKLDDVEVRLNTLLGRGKAQGKEVSQQLVLDFYHELYPSYPLDELKDIVDPNLTSPVNKLQRQTVGRVDAAVSTMRSLLPPHVIRGAIYMAAAFYIPKMVYRGVEGLYNKIDQIFTGSVKG